MPVPCVMTRSQVASTGYSMNFHKPDNYVLFLGFASDAAGFALPCNLISHCYEAKAVYLASILKHVLLSSGRENSVDATENYKLYRSAKSKYSRLTFIY